MLTIASHFPSACPLIQVHSPTCSQAVYCRVYESSASHCPHSVRSTDWI